MIEEFNAEDDSCPLGEKCSVHCRYDSEHVNDVMEYGRIITYFGDYAILTGDCTDYASEDLYETCVFLVNDGTLADLAKLPRVESLFRVMFVQTHDEWSGFKAAHSMVVDGVKEGILDLTTPWLLQNP